MTCINEATATIRFPKLGLELQPYTVDFRLDRTQFNYLEAKFNKEVGDYLRPLTNTREGELRDPQRVEVVMDGIVTHIMYFRPEYVTYGQTNTWIELHDIQKHLKFADIDEKLKGVSVEKAYETVFEASNKNTTLESGATIKSHPEIIEDMTFSVPDHYKANLDKNQEYRPGIYGNVQTTLEKYDPSKWWHDYDEKRPSQESIGVMNFSYKFDLTDMTCLEALYHLNDKTGLQTWSTPDGSLIAGTDFLERGRHVAANNDNRVWKYNNLEMTPAGTPIKMAVVNGGMVDAPNSTSEEGALESAGEFLNPTKSHEQDLLAQGVAKRQGAINGKVVSINEPEMPRDMLVERAKQLLANEVMNNNSGEVTINPATSGVDFSHWKNVKLGDYLKIIPRKGDDCGAINETTNTMVSGIKHKIDGASWDLNLDLLKWANPVTESYMRYFSPDSKNYYDDDFEEL